MALKKRIKIKEAKLGGRLLGQAIKEGDDYIIRISKAHRTEKSRLNTVVTEVLWREGYRRTHR